MPVDTFHRQFIDLIDARRWDRKRAEQVDQDVRFMILMSLEIYMNGRKPPGPRPLRDAVEFGRKPPPPEPDEPGVLFGAFGLCMAGAKRRRRTRKKTEDEGSEPRCSVGLSGVSLPFREIHLVDARDELLEIPRDRSIAKYGSR